MRYIVLCKGGYPRDRSTSKAGSAGRVRPVGSAAAGLLRLSDHQGPERLHRYLRVHPIPHPAPAGGGGAADGVHGGAQRTPAEILPHHPVGRPGHRPVSGQLAGNPTGL